MAKKILITGGSGLVGGQLSHRLSDRGYDIVHLSRRITGKESYPTFLWNVDRGEIDDSAFEGVNIIIHLAGAGVADERWTSKRKKLILDSRVESTKLLFSYTQKLKLKLDMYISASAVGIYPYTSGAEQVDEKSVVGDSYLADVVTKWEQSADLFKSIATVTKVRIGIVLSEKAGALKEIAKPIKMYAGAPLGSGKQYMSWIHEDDLVAIFQFVVEKKLKGTFNAVAPNPVTNKELTESIAGALGKPLFLPNVPPFAMKMLVGEMAEMLLNGTKVSANKIQKAGFAFAFEELDEAVADLLKS